MDADISVLHNIQVDKIRFNTSCTSVTDSIVSEVRQTLSILCITYLHLVAYFYRCGILQSPTLSCLSLLLQVMSLLALWSCDHTHIFVLTCCIHSLKCLVLHQRRLSYQSLTRLARSGPLGRSDSSLLPVAEDWLGISMAVRRSPWIQRLGNQLDGWHPLLMRSSWSQSMKRTWHQQITDLGTGSHRLTINYSILQQ